MATGEMTSEEFIAFNETYLKNMNAHLKDGAVVMACIDHSHIAELMAAARMVGLKHLNMCVWKKSNAGMGSLYRSHYELVLILKHGTAPHTNMVELGKHGRYRSNIWEYAGANSFSKTRSQDFEDHPTVKPRGLVDDAIRDVTRHGEIVLDAFSGSGTTILACETTHRRGYAIEIEPKYVLLGRDPTRRIMVATYSQDLARLHATHCRMIMQSPWYQRLVPGTVIADDGNRMFEIVTTKGGGRKAISVGGSVTGHGADIIVVDDCLKAEDARSEAKREEAKAWLNGTLATRLNSPGGGAILSISQRLHEDDLAAHLLDKGYDHLCLPAIADRDEQIALGGGAYHDRKVGDLLDRPGTTREKLEAERRNLGAQVFSAQFQQNPVASEGNVIRLEWFPTYEPDIDRERYFKVVQSWDTGLSDEPTADYSVCTTWGYLDGKWHLLDVLRQRLAFPDLKRGVLRLRRQWRPDEVVIEDAGTGKALWQEFRASGELRPIMWSVTQDKETRLIGVTGQLEAGLCLLPTEAPWLEDFRSELRAFPYGRHDDQVDTMTRFLEYLFRWSQRLLVERDSRGRPLRINRQSRRAA